MPYTRATSQPPLPPTLGQRISISQIASSSATMDSSSHRKSIGTTLISSSKMIFSTLVGNSNSLLKSPTLDPYPCTYGLRSCTGTAPAGYSLARTISSLYFAWNTPMASITTRVLMENGLPATTLPGQVEEETTVFGLLHYITKSTKRNTSCSTLKITQNSKTQSSPSKST